MHLANNQNKNVIRPTLVLKKNKSNNTAKCLLGNQGVEVCCGVLGEGRQGYRTITWQYKLFGLNGDKKSRETPFCNQWYILCAFIHHTHELKHTLDPSRQSTHKINQDPTSICQTNDGLHNAYSPESSKLDPL